jgi:hypothetical protein
VATRMTVQRLGRLIVAGDIAAVRTAVASSPGLLDQTSNGTGTAAGRRCTSPWPRAGPTSSGCWSRPAPT